jgi:hypothetical protein
LQEASKSNFVLDNLCVYVAQDCTINLPEVIQLCTTKSPCKSVNKEDHYTLNYAASTSSTSALRRKCRNSIKSLGSSFELASNAKDGCSVKTANPTITRLDAPLNSNEHSPATSTVGSTAASADDEDEDNWKAVMILVPLRLGGEKFNTIYSDCIRKLFCTPLCVGIIGGKPKHSMYFVGCQDDKLICLDPHYSQDTIDVIGDNNFPLESYHCSNTKKLPINRMDPSCTIAFYCKTRRDLHVLMSFTRNELRPAVQNGSLSQHSIFFFEENPTSASSHESSLRNSPRHHGTNSLSDCSSKCSDPIIAIDSLDNDLPDDFVLL